MNAEKVPKLSSPAKLKPAPATMTSSVAPACTFSMDNLKVCSRYCGRRSVRRKSATPCNELRLPVRPAMSCSNRREASSPRPKARTSGWVETWSCTRPLTRSATLRIRSMPSSLGPSLRWGWSAISGSISSTSEASGQFSTNRVAMIAATCSDACRPRSNKSRAIAEKVSSSVSKSGAKCAGSTRSKYDRGSRGSQRKTPVQRSQ